MPQVRVGIVGRAMRLVGNHTHFHVIQESLGFALCIYLTVTGTIILKLHSNVCDYLSNVQWSIKVPVISVTSLIEV